MSQYNRPMSSPSPGPEDVSYLLDDYEFKPSNANTNKYDVYKEGKYLISFGGDKNQPQFHDRIGYYSYLDSHNETLRDYHYDTTERGVTEESAQWFANKYLWSD